MKEFSIFILFTLFASMTAVGQMENPVSWTVKADVAEEVITITYEANIDDGWYVYSQYLESDLGPIPTSINLENKGLEQMGTPEELGKKKEGYDSLFEMNIVKYANQLSIVQKVKNQPGLKNIKGYIEFMTCDDSRCLPPANIDFDIAIN